MSVPDSIKRLVDHFEQNRTSYFSAHYKEAQLRQDFLNPFFIALGWDLFNDNKYSEAYRDVIIESSVEVEGAAKAPDYSFRIGGTRKFFVEAKKPSVNIEFDIHPAFQVRRYAWSAKLPLSILTDFEEFAVYDCRTRPDKTDKAATGRVKLIHYKDYLTRWDEIADTFSKDAVLHGKFDQFAQTATGKRGTQEVDDAFLQEIEKWRDLLARNIAIRNPNVSTRELNYAVQMTIDRIIFLRICEDRQIENEDYLKDICAGENIYPELVNLFHKADTRYNSGLFHFNIEKGQSSSPDDLTPTLSIDDKVLKDIISSLYFPSPYVFRVLPADILGQVYERFLGKVIRLTAGHQAKVEEKPEVRKAGGVYYTPTYIVDYIVKNTVGKLLENKTPAQAASLKIVDPACGSGSFLLGAYQYLLDWHVGEYSKEPEKWSRGKSPAIYQAQGGWRLTTAEKKKILLNNIHGVDIDPQAVEVTKLSLSLKVLEGESQETINSQLSLFKERALPDLAKNIQCGNSLIGSDYNEGKLFADEEERFRVNPFDWHVAFPQVFVQGGFDAVIGNPPWGAEFTENELLYFRNTFRNLIVRMVDSFMFFVGKGSSILRNAGYFGMILPDVILYQRDNTKLRKLILETLNISLILNMGNVFDKVTRPCAILVLEKRKPVDTIKVIDVSQSKKLEKHFLIEEKAKYIIISHKQIEQTTNLTFFTSNPSSYELLNNIRKINKTVLAEYIDKDGIQRGVSPDLKSAFIVDSKVANENHLEKFKLKRTITGGKFLKRYLTLYPDLWLIYTKPDDDFKSIPNIRGFIDKFASEITCKEVQQKKHSIYALHRARNETIFNKKEKIVGVITEDEIVVSVDLKQLYPTDGIYLFGVNEKCSTNLILGILNSKLFNFIYQLSAFEKGRALAQVKPTILDSLPIPTIDYSNLRLKTIYSNIVFSVEQILILNKKSPRTPQEKESLHRQITATDKQIDNLVYQLYGLTPEEIKIVEGT